MLLSLLQQSSWVIQVELAIGPEEGISYLTDKGSTVSSKHENAATYKLCLKWLLPGISKQNVQCHPRKATKFESYLDKETVACMTNSSPSL